MYFLLIFYIVSVGWLYRIFFGPYKALGLFHLFYLSYVVSIVVALPALDNGYEYYKVYVGAALSTPLFVLLGGLIGKVRFFPLFNSRDHYLYLDAFLQKRSLVILFAFSCFFLFYMLDVGIKSSGLLFALSNPGDSVAAMEIRMLALTSNVARIFTKLYGYSRAFFIPFLCCVFFVHWLKGGGNGFRFVFMFVVAVFYCAFSAAKAPVFYLVLTLALTYYWWSLNKNPRLAYIYLLKFLGVVVVGLLVSSLFYPLLHGVDGAEAFVYAWEQLNYRVFEVPSIAAMKYFEVFGSSIDFLGWKGSSVVSLILGQQHVSIGQVQIFLEKMPFSAISLVCKAVCSLAVMQLVLTSFTSILIGRGMLLLPFLIFIFVCMTRFLSDKSRY